MTAQRTALRGKNIILGITGGIAAYKSAELTRRLQDAGADVRVVMTEAATKFVTPLTFQALSGHQVFFENTDPVSESVSAAGMKHIELARWADIIIIAPASANTIAKLAHGRADNLLSTLCLASEAAKFFAPAMNRVMWDDASTQLNCSTLSANNWNQLGPASGSQACGETGEGRMLEASDIIDAVYSALRSGELQGLNVTITAGPTYEAIDPVRYIGNRSSGRMGYAIAAAAREAGAHVTLVSGPCHLPIPEKVSFISIESASEMQQAVMSTMQDCDIYISTAAISDYRVEEVAGQKIKKTEDTITLRLVKNDDILLGVTRLPSHPFVVGFAAETENLAANAKHKLLRKNLDMIAANDVSSSTGVRTSGSIPAIGFNSDYNALHVFWKRPAAAAATPDSSQSNEEQIDEQVFDVARKTQLAKKLVSLIAINYTASRKTVHNIHRAHDEKNTA